MDTSATLGSLSMRNPVVDKINCTYCIFWKLFPIDWEGCSHPDRENLPQTVSCPGFCPGHK